MMQNKFIPVCEPLLAGNELKYIIEAGLLVCTDDSKKGGDIDVKLFYPFL